ncbi:NAD-dependent epimerase/dehydratase family protein [Candidatus Uhrbacteria bacterium]|nr:NAD-dependent epimerase/dehydratase family protein [Candidatus Uhrbacteria bacterium]
MEKKCIVVIGGAGFIGAALCKELVPQEHRIISVDNYFTGSTERHISGVEYRYGHSRDIAQIVPESPDLVFHFGEYSRVEKSFEDPIQVIWDLNIAGTFSVLEFCRKKKCKLVYAGSSTKFADDGEGKNQSPYAWSKSANSELVCNYGKWFDLDFAITYFYNVYGEGEISTGPYATVIGIFKQLYERGLPLTVVSPGTQARCFTHISDIVNGLMLVAEKGKGDGYDIGNPQAFSMIQVAKMFSEDIMMLPERKGNRQSAHIDPSKIRGLGWEPRIALTNHIEQFKKSIVPSSGIEKRVLVLSTSFFPDEGPAERALLEVIHEMKDIQFDIITTQTTKESTTNVLPNANIYRVGRGDMFDKYRLMLAGVKKAQELSKQHSYIFTWAIMASYAAIAASYFRRNSSTPLLISLADHKIDQVRPWLRFVLRHIFKKADQISVSSIQQEQEVGRLSSQLCGITNNASGDAFANQVRFLYNMKLKS